MRCYISFSFLLILIGFKNIANATGTSCSLPPNFPSNIQLKLTEFINWAQAIQVQNLWTAIPESPDDVVQIANWAFQNNYTLRARGFMHTWSPLVVTPDQPSCGNVVLIDTTKYLTNKTMISQGSSPSIQVQTGASMDSILRFLELNNYALTSHPAPGDLTIGGVLAVGGHGAGVRISSSDPRHSFGSISNLVTSLNAVVWNNGPSQTFEIKTFDRSDPEIKALLTNLGRIFMTQVTLRVVPIFNVRCVSTTDIPATELFADPTTAQPNDRTFSKFLETSGSIETILFPFTTNPWTKIWTVTPHKPLLSTYVVGPYNYPFSDQIPVQVSNLVERIVAGEWELAPIFGQVGFTASAAGVLLTSDLWGHSKNVMLYVKPTTLRFSTNGYAILTNRGNIQLVLSKFYSFFKDLLCSYANRGFYPVNGPLEIRVSGLDSPEDVGIPNAESPTLSVLKPIDGRPDLNAAVWVDCFSFPTTPMTSQFMAELENFLFNFDESLAIVRPEWSKGWAYTNTSAWNNAQLLSQNIPNSYNSGVNGNDWDSAISIFSKYDPNQIFINPFLGELL